MTFFNEESSCKWNTPAGFWINGNTNSNSINLNLHHKSGTLKVIETNKYGCELEPTTLFIEVK